MFGTFQAHTSHGTVLAVETAIEELVHAPPDSIVAFRKVAFVYLTQRASNLAFLVFDNPLWLAFSPQHRPKRHPILITRREVLDEPTVLAFSDPRERTLLLAHPDILAEGFGRVVFHGHNTGAWETFGLRPPASDLPETVQHQIDMIEQVLTTPPLAIPALLRAADAVERPIMAALLAMALTPAHAELLANHLLAGPERLADFAALLPGDPWAEIGLPMLRRFRQARQGQDGLSTDGSKPGRGLIARLLKRRASVQLESGPASPYPIIGPELDRLAHDGAEGEYASIAHQCLVLARRGMPPVKDICVLATVRNEGLYIIDWLAYHRSVGVSRFFIYTNDNTDGSDILLRALAAHQEIDLVENKLAAGIAPQFKAYSHALSLVPDLLDYRWCAIIDGDEYIGFDKSRFQSLNDYIAWQERQAVDAIALNWNMVTSSGAVRWQDVALPFRFTNRSVSADRRVKTIMRPRFFHNATPHVPTSDGLVSVTCRDAVGEPHQLPSPFTVVGREGPAWIAHYFFRSIEEFIWKWSRGPGDQAVRSIGPQVNIPEPFVMAFISQFRTEDVVPDGRMARCAAGLQAERERILRVPEIAAAREQVICYYRQRSATVAPMLRELYAAATPVTRQFYDLLLATEVNA
jgi:hypothetical protein